MSDILVEHYLSVPLEAVSELYLQDKMLSILISEHAPALCGHSVLSAVQFTLGLNCGCDKLVSPFKTVLSTPESILAVPESYTLCTQGTEGRRWAIRRNRPLSMREKYVTVLI